MNKVLYGNHPQIFDMDEDLEVELKAKPSNLPAVDCSNKIEELDVNQSSPCGINGLESPFSVIAKTVELEDTCDDSLNPQIVNTHEQTMFSKKHDVVLPQDGFFQAQKTSSMPVKESMLSQVARTFEPYDFKKNHFFQVHRIHFMNVLNVIHAPYIHRFLWSEVMEELFYYIIHHQIKAYREAYDQVLDELVFDGFGEPDTEEPGFPGFSRTSSPQIQVLKFF